MLLQSFRHCHSFLPGLSDAGGILTGKVKYNYRRYFVAVTAEVLRSAVATPFSLYQSVFLHCADERFVVDMLY